MVRRNRVLHEFVRPYEGRRGEINLGEIRGQFSALMDQAAMALHGDGYDQDDCLLERFAEVRGRGSLSAIEVPIESLTDAERFLTPLWRSTGSASDAAATEIVRLGLRVIYEEGVPRPESNAKYLLPTDE